MGRVWWLAALAACSGGGTTGGDAGGEVVDSGPPPDAGVRALCPVDVNPACTQAMQCGTPSNPPTNCKGCLPFNRNLCELGQCKRSDPNCAANDCVKPLEAGDPVNFAFQVGSLQARLRSFAGVVVAAESSGGQLWTCEDVYAKRLDLASPCHNVLDTRGQDIAQPGNQYTMTFTRFASGRRALFIVYGYDVAESMGTPIGISCGAGEVGPPGSRLMMIPGDTMRPL